MQPSFVDWWPDLFISRFEWQILVSPMRLVNFLVVCLFIPSSFVGQCLHWLFCLSCIVSCLRFPRSFREQFVGYTLLLFVAESRFVHQSLFWEGWTKYHRACITELIWSITSTMENRDLHICVTIEGGVFCIRGVGLVSWWVIHYYTISYNII